MNIAENLKSLKEEINSLCKDCGRNANDIEMIAVSKFVDIQTMRKAYDLGVRSFGENRVQEFVAKKQELPEDISWHMIGRLQKNKVKDVLPGVTLIHSLDRVELADEIEKVAKKRNLKKVPCLIQVNITNEESKAGFAIDEVESFLSARLKAGTLIDFQGIMTIGPLDAPKEACLAVFQKAKELFLRIQENYPLANFKKLSMGMSGDYDVAIQAGANMLRIGSKVFGARTKV